MTEHDPKTTGRKVVILKKTVGPVVINRGSRTLHVTQVSGSPKRLVERRMKQLDRAIRSNLHASHLVEEGIQELSKCAETPSGYPQRAVRP